MLADTGCTFTVISERFARSGGLKLVPESSLAIVGIDGVSPTKSSWCRIPRIVIGDFAWIEYNAKAADYSFFNINKNVSTSSALPCVGILGADFFLRYGAVIDYSKRVMRFSDKPTNDLVLLAGRWRALSAERGGRLLLAPHSGTSSQVVFDNFGRFDFTGSAPQESFRVMGQTEQGKTPKVLAGFVLQNTDPTAPKKPGFVIFHYEVQPDRLALVKRNGNTKLPLSAMRMTTSNDPDAVMYHYVRIGSIPDEYGRTAADYVPWTRLLKRYGVALDGPYRVSNFDYSLNRDLTVTAVEADGPTTITWDLEGSRIVRRGPRATLAR